MCFRFAGEELNTLKDAQSHCILFCNGRGGYLSVTTGFSVTRCDQGVLIAAPELPNNRVTLVHRLQEFLTAEEESVFLSSQQFADETASEEGFRYLTSFQKGNIPTWEYAVSHIKIRRQLAMEYGENRTAVLYTIENTGRKNCSFTVRPMVKFAPKEQARTEPVLLACENAKICAGHNILFIYSNGRVQEIPTWWESLAYPDDQKDGRPGQGLAGCCAEIQIEVPAGERRTLELVLSTEETCRTAEEILQTEQKRLSRLSGHFRHPAARALSKAADCYIVRRGTEKTMIAGYPLFADWGRDTMIAMKGCCFSTGRFADAKSMLRTFLFWEKDGLIPNLFPEGGKEPLYNTVDAALLLIDCLWDFVSRTGDWEFAEEAFPVLERIIASYRTGTHHHIGMDEDGLIYAGEGMDQVTWMDVCVEGILPTPRHGKPVEVNAYWYNALRIMENLAEKLNRDPKDYGILADRVKDSFRQSFYMEDRGYLKDVISGTDADMQLRPNQIWALSLPFTMLSPRQEQCVFRAVEKDLYTPYGLRSLSPEDPQYRGHYGGSQLERDLSYHQGTVWVFPMGAYYLAKLKISGYSLEAAKQVEKDLQQMDTMLREECIGQLPEIYDGDCPRQGKGCFAQAWSVGEILRVYEAVQKIIEEV